MSKFTHEEIEEMLPYVLMGKSKIGVANQIIRQLLDENKTMREALEQYHSRHEAGMLPCRFTYEKGRKALGLGEIHECCPNPEE